MSNYDYTKNDIIDALLSVGITEGDNLFLHSNIGFFGILKEASSKDDYCKSFKNAILKVIGNNGTLIVPTFSYSYFNNELYDVNNTSTNCGIFAEYILKEPQSLRSDDPNFSISSIGKNSKIFTTNLPNHSFGKGSFWDKFLQVNGKLCRFNLNPNFMTFIHFVEKLLNVSYRYDKAFNGTSLINHKKVCTTYYHFVRDLTNSEHETDLTRLEKLSIKNNITKVSKLGRGKIVCTDSTPLLDIIRREITKKPSLLIKGKNF